VDATTLAVPGVELSLADIDSMRVDVAEALKDDAMLMAAYLKVVASYAKMIQKLHGEDSRGLNLEYAYYLWKSGNVDQAKAIYAKFIQKYPKEFTFYYAAARMYQDLKNYPLAEEYAEKAVQYGYGDNKIRSEERLVHVLVASGQNPVAVKKGKAFLSEMNASPNDSHIRTGHYYQSLQKAVDEAEKGKL
jgi:tetratricopeptide (TPR) repeat protein